MGFLAINGVILHYRIAGRDGASAVILCNSLGTDARTWDAVISPLAARFRVVSYDKRGHGLSDAPGGTYRIEDHVADLVGLADALGLDRFALAGVSVGGLIAQAVAARHPERISALVLCDTAARVGSDAFWNDRIAQVDTNGMRSIADSVIERWFSAAFRRDHPVAVGGWRNMLLRTDPRGYVATCATLRDTDLGPELGAIAAPALVVAGGEDVSTPPALVRETAERIARSRFELIAGAGHIPSIEQPVLLAGLIEDFFREVGFG